MANLWQSKQDYEPGPTVPATNEAPPTPPPLAYNGLLFTGVALFLLLIVVVVAIMIGMNKVGGRFPSDTYPMGNLVDDRTQP